MPLKKAIILDHKHFEENKAIITILTSDNLIKRTLIKSYQKKSHSLQIGNLIEYRFFGKEGSLGFIDYTVERGFGSLLILNRIKLSVLYCFCFIVQLSFREGVAVNSEIFNESVSFLTSLVNSSDCSTKCSAEYFRMESVVLNASGLVRRQELVFTSEEFSSLVLKNLDKIRCLCLEYCRYNVDMYFKNRSKLYSNLFQQLQCY